eukprot:TRINITY_DN3216_c0_g1_i1.p1 TRINITY_DN3216_c0_g1~~TRINITY_DN3216_c0_g1_i1.p1  ORF type:complete len:412 (+),score=76.77 TRINITY_DN3216_c0_g1_i1:13-1248(+)
MHAITSIPQQIVGKINELQNELPKRDLFPGERIIKGYASFAKGIDLKPWAFISPPLGDYDVEIKITHCGVCHSDLSMIRNELGMTSYPFIPGHEIVGVVHAVGSKVLAPGLDLDGTPLKLPASFHKSNEMLNIGEFRQIRPLRVGDRVGAGWLKSSCHLCEQCRSGYDNLCPQSMAQMGQNGACGGYADFIRLDSRWVFRIPDEIPSESVAPLLCAGATVFSPLFEYDIQPNTRLGLLGFGGLGHLFVQMAERLGCEVIVLSTSDDKAGDAAKLGASRFIDISNKLEMATVSERLDFILSTSYVQQDWESLLNCLKPNGVLCLAGIPPKNLNLPVWPLLYKQRKVVGSSGAPSEVIERALAFCAKYYVTAETELFSIKDVNKVLDNFEKNKGYRYRAVLRINGELEDIQQG